MATLLFSFSPVVIDDIIQPLKENLSCNCSQIQDDANSFARHLLRIVRLVPSNGHHQHGNRVTYSLIETM